MVVGLEAAPAEEVAERVDAVGHVVDDEQAHAAAPQQAGERRGERPADQVAERERERQAAERPDEEVAIDPADHRILHEVRRIALPGAALGVDEEPAQVRVHETMQRALPAALVSDVRAVRVTLLVGEGVVLAVVGDPRDHRALDRRRPEDAEQRANRPARLEAAVGQVAVEADRYPESREQVHDHEHEDVAPVEQVVPELPADHPKCDEGQHRDRPGRNPVSRFVLDRLHVIGRGRAWVNRCRRQKRLLGSI